MTLSRLLAATCRVLAPAVLLTPAVVAIAPAARADEPDTSAVVAAPRPPVPHRRSNWQLGAGGAGTLEGAGWSGVVTYERVLDDSRSLVARSEFVRVLDRGMHLELEWSIPEWNASGSDRLDAPDAWVNAFGLSVGGRYVRSGRPAHAYIESTFGPALEQARGRTRASAIVGISGGAFVQPARSPVGGFAELRMALLVGDSGLLVTGRAGLLIQRP